ncbi:DUF2474 domain-containing protein [Rhodopila sp.]
MRIITRPQTRWKQFGWFVGLWASGVVTVAAVAGMLHWILTAG